MVQQPTTSIARTIAVNSFALLFSNGAGNLLTLLTTLYIARQIGPALYGEFAFAISLVSFFTIFTSLGIDTIITREIAKDETKQAELMSTALLMKLALSTIALFLVNALAFIFYPNAVLRLAIAIRSLLLLFSSITATLTALFQARLQMVYPAMINLFSKIAFPLLVLITLISEGGHVQLIIASTIPFILESILLSMLALKQFLHLKLQFKKQVAYYLIRHSWPIALGGIIYIIYTRIDMLLLSLLATSESIGLYSAAINIIEPIQFITGGFALVLFPVLVRFYKTNLQGFYRVLGLSLKAAVLISAPLAITSFALSNTIIATIYGSSYSASSLALIILSPGPIFLSLAIVLGNTLTAIDKQRAVMNVVIFGAVVNTSLAYLLIGRIGFIGAAIATLTVFVTSATILFLITLRTTKLRIYWSSIRKIVFTIILATLIMFYLRLNPPLALVAGGLSYIILLFLTKTFTKEEYDLLREVISLKKKKNADKDNTDE